VTAFAHTAERGAATQATSAPPLRRALDIGFELTNLCNLHCTHCIRGSHQEHLEHLDLSLIERVLDEARLRFSPLAVVFTGGEPLAADLFPAAVAAVSMRAIPYRFVTNGWLIPRHVPLLLEHPPSYVRISLSGASAATHDAQRGRGSFRRALLAAAVLLSRGIRAEVSMLVTRESRGELRDAVKLAGDLGLPACHFMLPQPTPETALEGSDLAPAEWDAVAAEVRALAEHSALPVILDYGTSDALPRRACRTMTARQLYIDARGRVPFCCQLSRYGTGADPIIGDLTTESLADVFARAETTYADFGAETTRLHQIGRTDALDAYPCLSCARRHGKTGFLGDFPDHPWTALSRLPE
jgi:MoaA/NifB/PqqE/SkfB family radical SAM enzyme